MGKRVFTYLLIAGLSLGMTGAFASDTGSAAGKVKLSKKKLTLKVGATAHLKVKRARKKVKWSSKNTRIAKVSKKGVVKGVSAGKTKITAKIGKKKLVCQVHVKKATGKWVQVTLNGIVKEKRTEKGTDYYVITVTDKKNYGAVVTVRSDNAKAVREYDESTGTYGSVDKKEQIVPGSHLKVGVIVDATSDGSLKTGAEIEAYVIYLCK